MKQAVTVFLILTLLIGAAISLLIMDHHANGGCAASFVAGVLCLGELNKLAFFNIHLSFLRNFSEGLLAGFIAVILGLLLYAAFGSNFYAVAENPGFAYLNKRFSRSSASLEKKLIDWLSLFENSPAIS